MIMASHVYPSPGAQDWPLHCQCTLQLARLTCVQWLQASQQDILGGSIFQHSSSISANMLAH